MTSDHYAILGVTPTAEAAAISAAYRVLIRHYHPDTNPDPDAQAKARAITVAYSVLRDPQKRADYDARRSADENLWSDEERGEPPDRPQGPAMRRVGIALAVLAIGLVAAVWAWPQPDRPVHNVGQPQVVREQDAATTFQAEPVVELQPESERLARLREESEILSPPSAIVPVPEETVPAESLPVAPPTSDVVRVDRAHPLLAQPRHVAPSATRPTAPRTVPPQ